MCGKEAVPEELAFQRGKIELGEKASGVLRSKENDIDYAVKVVG